MSDQPGGRDENVALQESKPKLKKPRLYKVLLLNDDFTPMEFVVVILERFFGKLREQAVQIMLHVHQKGVGVCGVYPRDIAESKVRLVMDFSKDNQHPLQCTMEPDE
jgi:ATP-dependent Clp protease adaptor protein ClpS